MELVSLPSIELGPPNVLPGEGSGTAIFSGRREGLAMYFARLVRPFWKAKLTKPG